MNPSTSRTLLLAAPLLVLAPAMAQGDAAPTKLLEQQYKKEIALPYVKKGGWILDWDKARKQAAESDELIFAFFTRSDVYSIPCKDIQNRVLSAAGIEEFAATLVPFLHMTTKIPGKKHDDLHAKMGFSAFPTLCFIDAKGKVHYTLRISDCTLAGFNNRRDDVQRSIELARWADTDKVAGKELLFLRFKLRNIDFTEAQRRGAELKFSKRERAEYETQLVETMVRLSLIDAQEVLASAKLTKAQKARATEIVTDLEVEEAMMPLMRGFKPGEVPPYHICYDLFKAGKKPSDKTDARAMYWTSVANVACDKADVEALTHALQKVKQGAASANKAYLAILERRLAELKKQRDAAKKRNRD